MIHVQKTESPLVRTVAHAHPNQNKLLIFIEIWRREWDSNPRKTLIFGAFQEHCLKPLGHLSMQDSRVSLARPE